MRILSHIFLFILILLGSCKDKNKVKSYNYDLNSVIEKQYQDKKWWEDSKFLSGDTIAIKITSYREYENHNEFEDIEQSSIVLTSNKNFLLNADTIFSTENIISHIYEIDNTSIITQTDADESYYYLIIRNTIKVNFKLDNGNYVFSLTAQTKNGYNINDSILIDYSKRK